MGEENNFYLAPWVREYKEKEKAKQTWLLQLAEKYALSVEDSKHPNGHYMNEVVVTPLGTSLGTVSSNAMLDNLINTLRESAAKERKLSKEMILHIHEGTDTATKWLAPLVAAPILPLTWTLANSAFVLTPLTALSLYDAGKDVATGNVTWKTGLKALPALDIPRQIGLWDRLAALLGNNASKARTLGRELNTAAKNIKLQESSIFPGLIGWAPKQTINGFHTSNDAEFVPNFWFENWATKTHDAPKGIYLSATKPTSGFLTERPYTYQMLTTLEKPIIQIGEVLGPTKNGVRNLIERLALSMNADGIIYLGIKDNLMPNLTIIKTLNPDVKLNITSRGPARISLAERMGIPKGERNLPFKAKIPKITVDNATSITPEQWTAAQDAAIARGDMVEAQRLRDLHFKVSAPNTKVKEAVFNGSLSDKPFYEFNTNFRDAYWGGRNDYTTGAWFGTGDENTLLSFAGDNPNRLKKFYLNFSNPFIKDAGYRRWDKLLPFNMTEEDIAIEAAKLREKGFPEYVIEDWKNGLKTTTDNYALKLETTDYDSGIIKNVYENKAHPDSEYGVITDYIAAKPNQIKSADAVTYDDNSVRIPLGERDNFNISDIRYGLLPFILGGSAAATKMINNLKQGGKMNILQFLKNGSGIHIKKENRGKFTDYCGGKVTSECIAKGKRSSNPAIRKRATFAANARKWKHLEGGTLTYEQWQLMVPELKMAYNKNIAKSFLSSPTLPNLYNSVKAYFGGYAPKNPYLQTGIAPSPGMSSKALALLGKTKNAYNVERLLSKKSMLSGIKIPVEAIKDAIKTGDVPLVSTKIVEPIEETGLTIRKIKPIMLENYVSNPAERAAMLDFKAANPNVYVGKTKMLIGRPSLESYKEIMYPEAYEELVRKLGYKKQGGKVKKKHLAFVNGVSILDSNPDAYKYVKKKLHRAANGGNTGNWLSGVGNFINKNLNTISTIAGTAINGISGIVGSLLKLKSANDLIKANNLKDLVSLRELIAKYLLEEMERLQKEEGQYPGINSSPIVNNYVAYLRALLKVLAEIANLKNLTAEENAKILQEALSDLTNSIMGTVGNLAGTGIGLLSNNMTIPFRKNFTPKA